MAQKSVEETIQELMAFCEAQQKVVEKTAVSPTGWRRHWHAAVAAAFTEVRAVLGNIAPDDTPKENPNKPHERMEKR